MKSTVVILELDESLRDSLKNYLGSRSEDARVLLREFHNLFIKHVTPRPRAIHLSDEIKKHPLYNAEKKQVIEVIVSKVRKGHSVTPYLSEKSVQLEHYDSSLAHFGVHHFHLGVTKQKHGARAGRVKGTKSLLFVRFTELDAYFLDILSHGIRSGFLNMHLFRVMYRNWPASVDSFRLKHVLGLQVKHTDDEISALLESNVNTIVEMEPGRVFMLPGMGATTAGTSLEVERRASKAIDDLRIIANLVKNNANTFAALILKLTGCNHNVIRLRARIRTGLLDIYDASSGCVFNLQDGEIMVSVPDKF